MVFTRVRPSPATLNSLLTKARGRGLESIHIAAELLENVVTELMEYRGMRGPMVAEVQDIHWALRSGKPFWRSSWNPPGMVVEARTIGRDERLAMSPAHRTDHWWDWHPTPDDLRATDYRVSP